MGAADLEGIPGERFTALGQACHLRDIERDGYHVRFGRTLREERPDLASIDSYELAAARNYEADDVEAALIAFRKARRETVAMLQTVRTDDWNGARPSRNMARSPWAALRTSCAATTCSTSPACTG